jgi:hypothetical protein
MVHRDKRGGTWILDVRLGKLGRYKAASGTDDVALYRDLVAMLRQLRRARQWDVLALVVQRHMRPLDLYDAYARGELEDLPSPEQVQPIGRAVTRWLRNADVSDRTRHDYAARLTFAPDAQIRRLPELLNGARGEAIRSGKRQTFNNQLTAARAFIRDVFGRHAKLLEAFPQALDVTHREGNPQEPGQIRALAQQLPYPDELWALCLTGMRQSEYWGTWEALTDRVQIAGVKGRHGQPLPRVVPLVYRPARPRVAYSTFYKALVRDSGGALNVHDLRKTAQRWWEDAGVPDWRISLYAGHARGRQSLATIYRKPRDLTRLLVEDADRLRAWLGEPPSAGLRVISA